MNHDYRHIPFTAVKLTGGFWHDRQQINAGTTIHAVKKQFAQTGRFDAYKGDWREGMPNKPNLYWSGDIEKWIESVAYLIQNGTGHELIGLCDRIADCIEQNQYPDGYYNMWIRQMEPARRWSERNWHEQYSAGHLMEAAVAYYEATGKDTLLRCACKMADHIENVFVKQRSAAFVTCGHEEIELALVRLYRCTGEKRYLELGKFFIDERGKPENESAPMFDWANGRYYQAHLPVREQTSAEGHAVRAGYLYCGMADIAYEYGDEQLAEACRALFDNMTERRMYITGGIGSTCRCEGFTIDYDLPNLTAYSESCAAIALMLFCRRMLLLEPDSRYADVAERVLYNGFLSGTSLDGTAFFYENPLEIDPKLSNREKFANQSSRMPITQRLEVFGCSCCPPNITRILASLGDMLYTYSGDTLYVHHFMASVTKAEIGGKRAVITQHTDYPRNGSVHITLEGGGVGTLAVRIPGWCEGWKAVMGDCETKCSVAGGYALFALPAGTADGCSLALSFDMTPYAAEASPHIQDDSGRIAVMRGPVLYCLEGVDNGADLRDIHVDLSQPVCSESSDIFGLPILKAGGWRRDPARFTRPYQRISDTRISQPLTFIPYFAFANRGETEMIVWINP